MHYIRFRASNGAVVVSSRGIASALTIFAVSFASACVPSADLSSYSSAASNATAAPGDDRSPSPTRPSGTLRPDDDVEPSGGAPSSGESIVGSGAMLDPGANNAQGPSADDPTPSPNPRDTSGGARPDAGPLIPPAPDAGPPRPLVCTLEEARGPNGHCYVLIAAPLAWEAARANCQGRGLGWDLTSIRSAADSAFVTSLLEAETWVGGSDGASEETWAWVNDGFEFWQGEGEEGQPLNGAFVNWFEDEPNGSTSSDCMRLLDDSRWADLECTEQRPSVCEGPPS